MKKIKIIVTIGKSCKSDKVLTKLIQAGADMVMLSAEAAIGKYPVETQLK